MEATDRMQRRLGRWPCALALGVIVAGWCLPARAQLEEIVVTAQRAEHAGTPPGASLRRTGDYLTLYVPYTYAVIPATVSSYTTFPNGE